jgi:predicted dehydrogenase
VTTELRWGILATGSIARAFASHLPTSATGRLVAVASREPDRAQRFADRVGGDVTAYASYDALLEDAAVDAVYVATPHPMHAEWAIRAAEAGKRVLCEKPLTMNAAEAEAVMAAGGFVMEAFMYRSHPQTTALVELLRSGVIGDVRRIDAVHSFHDPVRSEDPAGRILAAALGGGGILDVGCYCVSGAALVASTALGIAAAEPVALHGSGRLAATGVDVDAEATLTFDGDIVATLTCGVDTPRAPLVRVEGTEGTIEVDAPWLPTLDGRTTTSILVNGAPVEVHAERGLYAYEADVVASGVAVPSAEETLANMRTLDRWRHAVGVRYEVDPW